MYCCCCRRFFHSYIRMAHLLFAILSGVEHVHWVENNLIRSILGKTQNRTRVYCTVCTQVCFDAFSSEIRWLTFFIGFLGQSNGHAIFFLRFTKTSWNETDKKYYCKCDYLEIICLMIFFYFYFCFVLSSEMSSYGNGSV